jgi:hypothetical protein
MIHNKALLMADQGLVVQMDIDNILKVKMKMVHHLQKDQKVKGHRLQIPLQDKTLILRHHKVAATERSKKIKKMLLLLMHRTLNQHILRQLKM